MPRLIQLRYKDNFEMKKMVFVTTIPESLDFFKGQLKFLSTCFDISIIASPGENLYKIADREKVKAIAIPMKRPVSICKDLIALIRFIIVLARLRPDIVHGNIPKGSFLSMLAAFVCRVPHRIYMCHGLRYQGAKGIMRNILMLMERITCRCATRVICVSEGIKNTLATDKICRKKTRVLLNGSVNGIDLKYFNPAKVSLPEDFYQKHALSSDDFIYCFVGRIVKDKGINELCRAFLNIHSSYPNTRLLIIGNLEMEQNPVSVESLVAIQNNEAIRHLDFQQDIRAFLIRSDVLVLPSYREGFGMVLMEAGAMEVPVIASDIAGCNNVVIPDVNGILVTPRSVDSLEKAMLRLYKDRDYSRMLRSRTRNSIKERFDQQKVWQVALEEYLKYK